MADYFITCVKKEKGVIVKVGIGLARNGAGRNLETKRAVVDTYFGTRNRVFVPNPRGADAEVYVVDKPGGPYLRTVADGVPEDNLGNLLDC